MKRTRLTPKLFEDPDDPCRLLEREQVRSRGVVVLATGRHAVDAGEVAAVGDREAQIGVEPPARIRETRSGEIARLDAAVLKRFDLGERSQFLTGNGQTAHHPPLLGVRQGPVKQRPLRFPKWVRVIYPALFQWCVASCSACSCACARGRNRPLRRSLCPLGPMRLKLPLARAEPAPSTDEARKQFRLGVEEARKGHWAEALVAFQVSYALVPNPAALFNLAGAQHRTGKLLVSNANYRRFNASNAVGISANHRKAAETEMARIEASIPRLRVVVEGLRPEDRLLIDNKRIYLNELDHDLWVDPGPPHRQRAPAGWP